MCLRRSQGAAENGETGIRSKQKPYVGCGHEDWALRDCRGKEDASPWLCGQLATVQVGLRGRTTDVKVADAGKRERDRKVTLSVLGLWQGRGETRRARPELWTASCLVEGEGC